MTTGEAAIKWGVSVNKVREWCRKAKNKQITQKKKRAWYFIPDDYPNPFAQQ